MKKKKTPPQDPVKAIQEIFRERGLKALQATEKEILSEKIESPEVREALTYFMKKYWRDTTRPGLLSLFCEAVGGKAEITAPIATSAILISGAVDIQNDIINRSKTKKVGATIFGKFGKDIALLVGDALLFKGLTSLFQAVEKNISSEKLSTILDITKRTFFELGDAEALEQLSRPQQSHLKKEKTSSQEEIIERVQRILKERNVKPLEMARKEVLGGDVKSREVQEALNYFVKEWWEDIPSFMLGPTVISSSCEAVGGNPQAVVPIAASEILIRSGIQMHDDIIDRSKIKKSRLTILGKFGTEKTIIAGRTLMIKGFTLLNEAYREGISVDKITRISGAVENAFFEFGDAEGMTLELRGKLDITPEKCMHIIRKKGSIIEGEARIGAMIGGGNEEEIEALGQYGRILGILSTIRGEFIDMFEADELSHKIDNECLPLPILYALQNQKAKKEIIHIIKKERRTKKDVDTLVDVVYGTQEVKSLKEIMQNLAEEASLTSLVQSEPIEVLRLLISATLIDL